MNKISLVAISAAFFSGAAFADMADRPTLLQEQKGEWNQSEITRNLETLGYEQVSNARLSGSVYTASGYWQGEPIDIRIDTDTGYIADQNSMRVEQIALKGDASEEQWVSALESAGFTDVQDVVKAGQIFRATASRDGMSHNLRADAATGVLTMQSDRTQPSIGNATAMSDAQIVSSLNELGYENGRDVQREGNVISVKAERNGSPVDLNIDARNGSVSTQN